MQLTEPAVKSGLIYSRFCSGCQKLIVYDGSVREAARSQAAAVGALAEVRL